MTLRVMHLAEVALRVIDLPRIVAFYQEVLGLEIVRAYPTIVFVGLPTWGLRTLRQAQGRLCLQPRRRALASDRPPSLASGACRQVSTRR